MSGIGERFTERGQSFDAVGEPGNDVDAGFAEGGETVTDGENRFTDVGGGFRDVGETSDDGGGGFTERGKNFDDGGTESFVRRGRLDGRAARTVTVPSVDNGTYAGTDSLTFPSGTPSGAFNAPS